MSLSLVEALSQLIRGSHGYGGFQLAEVWWQCKVAPPHFASYLTCLRDAINNSNVCLRGFRAYLVRVTDFIVLMDCIDGCCG